MIGKNLKIMTIFCLKSTFPICPFGLIGTARFIWNPFSRFPFQIGMRKNIRLHFENLTESFVNILFHSSSDGGLNFFLSSKVTSKYIKNVIKILYISLTQVILNLLYLIRYGDNFLCRFRTGNSRIFRRESHCKLGLRRSLTLC